MSRGDPVKFKSRSERILSLLKKENRYLATIDIYGLLQERRDATNYALQKLRREGKIDSVLALFNGTRGTLWFTLDTSPPQTWRGKPITLAYEEEYDLIDTDVKSPRNIVKHAFSLCGAYAQ